MNYRSALRAKGVGLVLGYSLISLNLYGRRLLMTLNNNCIELFTAITRVMMSLVSTTAFRLTLTASVLCSFTGLSLLDVGEEGRRVCKNPAATVSKMLHLGRAQWRSQRGIWAHVPLRSWKFFQSIIRL